MVKLNGSDKVWSRSLARLAIQFLRRLIKPLVSVAKVTVVVMCWLVVGDDFVNGEFICGTGEQKQISNVRCHALY